MSYLCKCDNCGAVEDMMDNYRRDKGNYWVSVTPLSSLPGIKKKDYCQKCYAEIEKVLNSK